MKHYLLLLTAEIKHWWQKIVHRSPFRQLFANLVLIYGALTEEL